MNAVTAVLGFLGAPLKLLDWGRAFLRRKSPFTERRDYTKRGDDDDAAFFGRRKDDDVGGEG